MAAKAIAIIGAGLAGLAAGGTPNGTAINHTSSSTTVSRARVAARWRRARPPDRRRHPLSDGAQTGRALHALYRQLGTAFPETLIDMAEYGRFVDETSGRNVLLTADLAQCAAALKASHRSMRAQSTI